MMLKTVFGTLFFLSLSLSLFADDRRSSLRDKPDLYEKNRNQKEEEELEKRRYYLNYDVKYDDPCEGREEECEVNENR